MHIAFKNGGHVFWTGYIAYFGECHSFFRLKTNKKNEKKIFAQINEVITTHKSQFSQPVCSRFAYECYTQFPLKPSFVSDGHKSTMPNVVMSFFVRCQQAPDSSEARVMYQRIDS